MRDKKLSTFGVTREAVVRTVAAQHAEEIRGRGFSVTSKVFEDSDIDVFKKCLSATLKAQHDEVGGRQKLKTMEEQYIARALIGYDEVFLRPMTAAIVLDTVTELLGPSYIVNQQNGIICPAADVDYTPAYHRDLPYQHFRTSKPLGITAILCLDAFDDKNGGTAVLPGSHHVEMFPGLELAAKIEDNVCAPAGAYILLDAMLFHRTGTNTTSEVRHAIAQTYTIPFIKQIISLPTCLMGKYSDDPRYSYLLGYGSESGQNVLSWRRTKGLTSMSESSGS